MFDSPIFWAILVFWLLSKFLGIGKRRPARQIEYDPEEIPEDLSFEEVCLLEIRLRGRGGGAGRCDGLRLLLSQSNKDDNFR